MPGDAPFPFTTAPRKGRDPARPLKAALARLAGGAERLVAHSEAPWASITFTGARHTMTYLFEGDDAVAEGESFIAELPNHEFAIPGKLVAEATVTSVLHEMLPQPRLTVECELLVLDDA